MALPTDRKQPISCNKGFDPLLPSLTHLSFLLHLCNTTRNWCSHLFSPFSSQYLSSSICKYTYQVCVISNECQQWTIIQILKSVHLQTMTRRIDRVTPTNKETPLTTMIVTKDFPSFSSARVEPSLSASRPVNISP